MAMAIQYYRRQVGFTLLEVMLVLLLMGLAAGYVVFNAFSASQADKLEEQVRRMQVIVDMASDYAVLNQMQIGLRIEEQDNRYFFMHLDDEDQWQIIEGNTLYESHQLPEPFYFALNLTDLPWIEEDRLFDREIFDETLSVSEDGVSIGEDEPPPPPPPQILILSSGEITPFALDFAFEPDFGSEQPVYFRLLNEDMPPLTIEGPLESRP